MLAKFQPSSPAIAWAACMLFFLLFQSYGIAGDFLEEKLLINGLISADIEVDNGHAYTYSQKYSARATAQKEFWHAGFEYKHTIVDSNPFPIDYAIINKSVSLGYLNSGVGYLSYGFSRLNSEGASSTNVRYPDTHLYEAGIFIGKFTIGYGYQPSQSESQSRGSGSTDLGEAAFSINSPTITTAKIDYYPTMNSEVELSSRQIDFANSDFNTLSNPDLTTYELQGTYRGVAIGKDFDLSMSTHYTHIAFDLPWAKGGWDEDITINAVLYFGDRQSLMASRRSPYEHRSRLAIRAQYFSSAPWLFTLSFAYAL